MSSVFQSGTLTAEFLLMFLNIGTYEFVVIIYVVLGDETVEEKKTECDVWASGSISALRHGCLRLWDGMWVLPPLTVVLSLMALTEQDKSAERICVVDLNGKNLWIYRAYLWISDHCRVMFRVRVRVRVRVRNMVRAGLVLELGLALGLGLLIVVYKLLEKWQNADQSRDQNWPMAIRPAPHLVVS